MAEIRCLSDHQDQIRSLINVNGQFVIAVHGSEEALCFYVYLYVVPSSDGLFASGSHAGELILWDAVDWNILAYEHILWEESQSCARAEIRLNAPKPSEMSIQHLSTDGKAS